MRELLFQKGFISAAFLFNGQNWFLHLFHEWIHSENLFPLFLLFSFFYLPHFTLLSKNLLKLSHHHYKFFIFFYSENFHNAQHLSGDWKPETNGTSSENCFARKFRSFSSWLDVLSLDDSVFLCFSRFLYQWSPLFCSHYNDLTYTRMFNEQKRRKFTEEEHSLHFTSFFWR